MYGTLAEYLVGFVKFTRAVSLMLDDVVSMICRSLILGLKPWPMLPGGPEEIARKMFSYVPYIQVMRAYEVRTYA